MNTGNSFRSSDLGVMSPARCLCAMPVKQGMKGIKNITYHNLT